ncbi:hypothetical protein CA850_28230 [Micromonospora echinospora]|uniref:DoxX-like family protein n=1 Tax=Micromonospora echinospora TaxID=1877 RepID=A0A1C4ZWU7_MICEC|nr:DoxX family protein [Micromonospora echinospora]OZV75726.1 hypothetical protein CA850_28230 [Micromonospora echinospora]SCF37341.1 DoxX-like family protein [Micromonospora echinospora]
MFFADQPGDGRGGATLARFAGTAAVLTPVAAACLAVVMVLAAAIHICRREPSAVAFNAVLFLLAALVVWGRSRPYGW